MPISESTCVIRGAGAARGRTRFLAPGRSPAVYLHAGRILLAPSDPPLSFFAAGQETGLICVAGAAEVAAGAGRFTCLTTPYTSRRIPRSR